MEFLLKHCIIAEDNTEIDVLSYEEYSIFMVVDMCLLHKYIFIFLFK